MPLTFDICDLPFDLFFRFLFTEASEITLSSSDSCILLSAFCFLLSYFPALPGPPTG